MELPTFIPVLASLSILFQPAMPSDLPLPPPDISVSPMSPRFIGDAVSITCTAPGDRERIQGFRFSGASGVRDVRTSKATFVHTFTVTGPRAGGAHTCAYTALRPGRGAVRSPESRAVAIDVRDLPTRPNLTVTPATVTVEGQPLVFLCSAPPGAAERRFGFFQDELEVTEGILEGSGSASARLRVEKSDRNHTGNFSCRYRERTEGRWVGSYGSAAVLVLVTAPCPAPLLWVEPPSGVVTAGRRLRLTCAAPQRHFRHRFRFFRNGDVMDDVMDDVISYASGNESHLLFPRVSREFAGNFSCRVEEKVGGAWLEAPPSRDVAVVVVGDFSPPAPFGLLPLVVGVVVGVALLLLGLLLAAWLCRKRRGGSRWRGLRPGDDTGTFSMRDLEVAS